MNDNNAMAADSYAAAAKAYEEIRQLRRKVRLYHEILQGQGDGPAQARARAAKKDVTLRLLASMFAFSEEGHEDLLARLLARAAQGMQ